MAAYPLKDPHSTQEKGRVLVVMPFQFHQNGLDLKNMKATEIDVVEANNT